MRLLFTIMLSILLLTSITGNAQLDSSSKPHLFIGHLNRLYTLDSLIRNAGTLALHPSDYTFQLNEHINNELEEVMIDSAITEVAIHLFSDMAYGNTKPKLDYNGAKFKLNLYDIPNLVKEYADKNALGDLVQLFIKNNKEVGIILDSLKYYLDNKPQDPEKIKILMSAANDYRWLNTIKKNNKFILVNIPSAQLKAYDSNKMVLGMRVIVGKSQTPTSTLSSQIKTVILNPYWTVPKSIIKNEMFDKFLEDRDYFLKNGFTLIDGNRKTVDPCTLDMTKYSKNNFPFIVRQGTGLDNSLGLLKIEFDSPSSIYLHDTPQKNLFSNAKRFYSHGCVRMENAIEIGNWLLHNNRKAIDTFDFKKPEKYTTPRPIPVTSSTQVIIWYSLIDFDKKGALKFYKNIYNK